MIRELVTVACVHGCALCGIPEGTHGERLGLGHLSDDAPKTFVAPSDLLLVRRFRERQAGGREIAAFHPITGQPITNLCEVCVPLRRDHPGRAGEGGDGPVFPVPVGRGRAAGRRNRGGCRMTTEAITHEIRLQEVRPSWWKAICSCGKYKSLGYGYPGYAERVGGSHVRGVARRRFA
ncbi:hypothetical protein ACIA5D_17840 [Actinoplanes sp. NPDC051513]|uniref:hypothetical protein n=1 Tax=Actinoplanes sp. NPDC051513 TaxID=3363908 RepID=UPI0037A44027